MGRGLGTLLGGQKVAGSEAEKPAAPEPQESLSPGVRSLIRGSAKDSPFAEPATNANKSAAPEKPLIPRWYFFAADVLLVATGLLIAFRSRAPLDWKETFFCIGTIVAGCACGIVGAMMGRKSGE